VRQALAIASRDLRGTYASPFGIGTTAGFVAVSGVVLVIDLRGNEARFDGWFAPLFVILGVLAALLTMRSFADEERAGTLELLLTSPVRRRDIVAGKLLGVVGVLLACVAGTVACPLLVGSMASPDWGPVITGYVGVVLLGLAFVSIGLAVSAATSNPLVAAAGTLAVLLGLWALGLVAGGLTGWPRLVLEGAAPSGHVTGFLRGTIAVADVTYFVTLTIAGATATVVTLGVRR
jgi:ABC-2 type transport system permease protein